jgi:hypothetical protein
MIHLDRCKDFLTMSKIDFSLDKNFEHSIETFPLFNDVNVLKVTTKSDEKNNIKENVVIALDRSGSMYYVINDVCKASISILKSLFDNNKSDNVYFAVYNQEVKAVNVKPSTYNDALVAINNIKSGGQTSFAVLLTTIQSYLDTLNDSEPVTLFILTDGQETFSPAHYVDSALKNMKNYLKTRTGPSKVVTLGYTREHDAKFLTTLSDMGTHPGFFAYSENSSDLKSTMSIVEKVLSVKTLNATLTINNEDTKITLIQGEEDMSTYAYFTGDIPDNVKLVINNQEFSCPVKKITPSQSKKLEAKLVYVSENLKVCMKEKTGDMARKLHKCLTTVRDDAFKLRDRSKRKKIFQDTLVIGKALDEILSNFAKGSNSRLDNVQLAKISNLSYSGGNWKMATQRKMNLRKDKNAKLFNDIEEKINDATKTINFDTLKNINPPDTCIYSCLNWVDALQDGDCLGIALDVSRSEVAIHDSTHLIIKSIHPSFITGNSFMDALEYALKDNYNASDVHGGFDKKSQGKILPGVARENITGMLPLYYHPQHWKIAKHQMKPILGWMVTLDPLGYDATQYTSIPYLVMCKASQDTSERGRKIFRMVADTCHIIYKEWKKMSEHVQNVFNNYVDNPSMRTMDIVHNQGRFLARLFCSMREGDVKFRNVEHIKKFWYSFVDESLRRFFNRKNKDMGKLSFCDYYNINGDEYVKPFVEFSLQEARENNNTLKDKVTFIKKLYPDLFPDDEKVEVLEKKKLEMNFIPPWENNNFIVEDNLRKKYIDHFRHLYTLFLNSTIYSTWKKFLLLPSVSKDPEMKAFIKNTEKTLDELPFMNDKIRLAHFCFETINQKENTDRRYCIENNYYRNYFEDVDYKNIMIDNANRELRNKKNDEVSKVMESFKNTNLKKEGEIFAKTNKIVEAVALLHGKYHGGNLTSFFIPLTMNVCPLAKEKLKMLLTGKYKNIPLLKDKCNGSIQSNGKSWYPGRKNARRFYFNIGLRNGMTVDEWISEFPETKKYVLPLREKNVKFDVTKL